MDRRRRPRVRRNGGAERGRRRRALRVRRRLQTAAEARPSRLRASDHREGAEPVFVRADGGYDRAAGRSSPLRRRPRASDVRPLAGARRSRGTRTKVVRTFHARRVLRGDPLHALADRAFGRALRHQRFVRRRAADSRTRSVFTPPPLDHRQFDPDGADVRERYGVDADDCCSSRSANCRRVAASKTCCERTRS